MLAIESHGKRQLRRPRHRREENVTIDLREMGYGLIMGIGEHGVETSSSVEARNFLRSFSR
jgi:hypothetical protein